MLMSLLLLSHAEEHLLCGALLMGSVFFMRLNTRRWSLEVTGEDCRPGVSHLSACLASGSQECLVSGGVPS